MQVGQRYEAAVQERIAKVVVLDVQRPAQAGRVLVNEAKRAVVIAALDTVERGVNELQAQVLLLRLPDREDQRCAAPSRATSTLTRLLTWWNW